MNTQHLMYAVEVEKMGSISHAAEKLFMGQPTLSKSIKELESYLGYEIFERMAKGVKPTKKGELFLTYAKKILSELEKIENISTSEDDKISVLDIAVPRATYISHTFASFAASLKSEKRIKLTYKETSAMRTINKVSIGEYHLGIIRYNRKHEEYFDEYFKKKHFKSEVLLEYDSLALMSKNNPLSVKEDLSYSDFSDSIELLHSDDTVPYFLPTEPEKETEGFEKHIYIFERGTQFGILNSVSDSYIKTSPVPDEVLERYSLVQRKCDFPDGKMKDVLIYFDDYTLTQTELEFIDAIKQTIRTL